MTERDTLEFRAEFFNILNHADWGLPDAQAFTQLPGGVGNINPSPARSQPWPRPCGRSSSRLS